MAACCVSTMVICYICGSSVTGNIREFMSCKQSSVLVTTVVLQKVTVFGIAVQGACVAAVTC